MGRRGVSLADPGRWVFNRLADAYRARPPWPDLLADRLAELAGGRGGRVADLGAGTGDLALPLARRGLRVTAVEPALAMLAVLEERREPGLDVVAVHAAAEATGLAPAAHDLALLADAVQWVDPERAGREAARLLASNGVAAVVEARFAATPFMEGLASLLARANPRARPRPPGAARQVLALAAGPGAVVAEERFAQDLPLDRARLGLVVRSLSYAGPALGPRALDGLVTGAERLARAVGEARFQRDVTLRWARRRASG